MKYAGWCRNDFNAQGPALAALGECREQGGGRDLHLRRLLRLEVDILEAALDAGGLGLRLVAQGDTDIYPIILLSLLPFSAKMTVSPRASA
jgi:hypothetical protein